MYQNTLPVHIFFLYILTIQGEIRELCNIYMFTEIVLVDKIIQNTGPLMIMQISEVPEYYVYQYSKSYENSSFGIMIRNHMKIVKNSLKKSRKIC